MAMKQQTGLRWLVDLTDVAHLCSAYQDFFAQWKDADADITILKQAKTAYAKLQ